MLEIMSGEPFARAIRVTPVRASESPRYLLIRFREQLRYSSDASEIILKRKKMPIIDRGIMRIQHSPIVQK